MVYEVAEEPLLYPAPGGENMQSQSYGGVDVTWLFHQPQITAA